LPAPRGRQPQEIAALLERVRDQDREEPFWRGVERLEASGGRVALDFHTPRDPRLQRVGEVDVACHLYGTTDGP
jgi:peptide/nickel transport system ATP-binding protein